MVAVNFATWSFAFGAVVGNDTPPGFFRAASFTVAGVRPRAVVLSVPAYPEVIGTCTEPVVPVPLTWTGAFTVSGLIASVLATECFADFQTRRPNEYCSSGAPLFSNVTLYVVLRPGSVTRIRGDTVTLRPVTPSTFGK